MKKYNCWEFKKCGREPGGEKADRLGICPAVNPNVAKVEGAADPRRQGCSCSNLPQALDNAGRRSRE